MIDIHFLPIDILSGFQQVVFLQIFLLKQIKFFPKLRYLTQNIEMMHRFCSKNVSPEVALSCWILNAKFQVFAIVPLFCHYYKLYYVTLLISWVSGWMHGMVANTAIGKEGRLLSLPLSRCWKLSCRKRFLIQFFFTPLKYSNSLLFVQLFKFLGSEQMLNLKKGVCLAPKRILVKKSI